MKIDLDRYMLTAVEDFNATEFLAEVCGIFKKYHVNFENLDDVLYLIRDAAYADLCGYGKIFEKLATAQKAPVTKREEPAKKPFFW